MNISKTLPIVASIMMAWASFGFDERELSEDIEQPVAEEEFTPNRVIFWKIPYDCWRQIFQYLEMKDQLSFLQCSNDCCQLMMETWAKSKVESNKVWRQRYEATFGTMKKNVVAANLVKWVEACGRFVGMKNNAPRESEICWRQCYIDKDKALARKNAFFIWAFGWIGETKNDKYFYGADLRGFATSPLANFDVSYANFIGADLRYSDLSNFDFTGARMHRADCRRTHLSRMIKSLRGRNVPAYIRKVKFLGADISGADFRGALVHAVDSEEVAVSLAHLKELRGFWDENDPPLVSQ